MITLFPTCSWHRTYSAYPLGCWWMKRYGCSSTTQILIVNRCLEDWDGFAHGHAECKRLTCFFSALLDVRDAVQFCEKRELTITTVFPEWIHEILIWASLGESENMLFLAYKNLKFLKRSWYLHQKENSKLRNYGLLFLKKCSLTLSVDNPWMVISIIIWRIYKPNLRTQACTTKVNMSFGTESMRSGSDTKWNWIFNLFLSFV